MPGKRIALLIANGNYQHAELRKLNTPHSDVQALEALLKRPDMGGYETQLLLDGTKAIMEESIERVLANGERDDTTLIFLGGHGIKHETGKLYFAAIDTKPDYLGRTAVSAAWLTEEMQNSRTGRQIILLDCCFGGAFAKGNVWRGGERIESGKMLEVPNLELEGRSQLVISSSDAMQFALEGGILDGKQSTSAFVRALIEGLETGEADGSLQDGLITVDEVMEYLARKLKMLGSTQHPSMWTFGSGSEGLLFAFNPRVNAADWMRIADHRFNAGDYSGALALYKSAADRGDAQAMARLGELYEDGRRVAQDHTKAIEWYQKAADNGEPGVIRNLATLYEMGVGVEQTYSKAREWYQRAADADLLNGLEDGRFPKGLTFLPDVTCPKAHPVDCTVFAPNCVERTGQALLQVFLHAPKDREQAQTIALKFDAGTKERGHRSLALDAPIGTKFTFDVEVQDFLFKERVEALLWTGAPQSVSFPFVVPARCKLGQHTGVVRIWKDQNPVGRISFQIEVVGRVQNAHQSRLATRLDTTSPAFARTRHSTG